MSFSFVVSYRSPGKVEILLKGKLLEKKSSTRIIGKNKRVLLGKYTRYLSRLKRVGIPEQFGIKRVDSNTYASPKSWRRGLFATHSARN